MTFPTQTDFFSIFNSCLLDAGRHFSTIYINLTDFQQIEDWAESLNSIATVFLFKISAEIMEPTQQVLFIIFSLTATILGI